MADGIVTYTCDTCNRDVDVLYNKYGIDTAQRCIITDGCLGTLHKKKKHSVASRAQVLADPVDGLEYWYQKKLLYQHVQSTTSTTWKVKHNLGIIPAIKIYIKTQTSPNATPQYQEVQADSITQEDKNTLILTFAAPVSGFASCFTVTSENRTEQVTTPTESRMLLTNAGELTIAVDSALAATFFDVTPTFALTATFNSSPPFQYTYKIDNFPSILSPWVNVAGQQCVVNGKRYQIFSFNVVSSDIQRNGISSAPVVFSLLDLVAIAPKQVIILLASPPFTVYDKIANKYVDVTRVDPTNPQLSYNNGEMYAEANIVSITYPPIFYR